MAAGSGGSTDDDVSTSTLSTLHLTCFTNSLENPNVTRIGNLILGIPWTLENSNFDPCANCNKQIQFGAFNLFDEYLCKECFEEERKTYSRLLPFDDPSHFRVMLTEGTKNYWVDPEYALKLVNKYRSQFKLVDSDPLKTNAEIISFDSVKDIRENKVFKIASSQQDTMFEPKLLWNILLHDTIYTEFEITDAKFVFKRNDALWRKLRRSTQAAYLFAKVDTSNLIANSLYLEFSEEFCTGTFYVWKDSFESREDFCTWKTNSGDDFIEVESEETVLLFLQRSSNSKSPQETTIISTDEA